MEYYSKSAMYQFINELNFVRKIYEKNNLAYHNFTHILDCLNEFNNHIHINLADKSRTYDFILAILYHDIVYVPGAEDNEEQSFNLFKEYNQHINEGDRFNYIENIILSTKIPKTYNPKISTKSFKSSTEAKMMHDIDYAGFSWDFNEYIKISNAIWEENKNICGRKLFLEKRIEFLESINKDRIYYYKITLESKAHENINKELEILNRELRIFKAGRGYE